MLSNKMKRGMKKGISPVIATVLLIAMVVVVALIVFIWFRGMVGETCEKFEKACELNCEDVEFDASYSSSGKLSIVNTGNVPIFQLRVKIFEDGSYNTEEIDEDFTGWDAIGLGQGGTFSGTLSVGSADKITVFPVLIGEGKDGRKIYVCEGQYGEDIIII